MPTYYVDRPQYVRNSTVQLFSDNWASLKYVAPVGAIISYILQTLALQIQEITNEYNLTVQHIKADKLSRRKILLHEWKLPRKMIQDNRMSLGERMTGVFAIRQGCKVKTFWGYLPDPEAAATYTFTQAWAKKSCTSTRPGSRFQKIQETILVTT